MWKLFVRLYFFSFLIIGNSVVLKILTSFLLNIYKTTYHGQIKDLNDHEKIKTKIRRMTYDLEDLTARLKNIKAK